MSRTSPSKAKPAAAMQPEHAGFGVGHLMGRARASLLSALDRDLERFGLNGMQFAVLKNLSEGSARTAADLCRLMHHDTGAMTRIVDRLEEKGLLRRERCREDRRVVFLRIAPAGRAQLPRLMAVGARVIAAHLAGFSQAEIAALRDYLGRMIDNGQREGQNQDWHTGGKP